MIFKDYYKILGLNTSKVSLEEIKNAYRKSVKKNHPDVNGQDTLAEEKIKDINEAYNTLTNNSLKRKYDRIWNSNVGNKSKVYGKNNRGLINQFSNIFFGGNIKETGFIEDTKKIKAKSENGQNVETEMQVSVMDAFFGVEKEIILKDINGRTRKVHVKIPDNIQNGEKLRLVGQGKEGKNGGNPGDLIIKIILKDTEKYKLKGTDLYTDLMITPWEAALGGKVNAQTIDEEIPVYLPQGLQSGEIIKIPAKGYKDKNGSRGDLVAQIKIMVPKIMTDDEKNMFKKLNEISKFNPRAS